MVVSLKANRKRILAFILLAAIVAGACFFLTGRGEEEARQPIPGGTNEERVAFLESFGWQVQAEPTETREVMIPAQFNDVYTASGTLPALPWTASCTASPQTAPTLGKAASPPPRRQLPPRPKPRWRRRAAPLKARWDPLRKAPPQRQPRAPKPPGSPSQRTPTPWIIEKERTWNNGGTAG